MNESVMVSRIGRVDLARALFDPRVRLRPEELAHFSRNARQITWQTALSNYQLMIDAHAATYLGAADSPLVPTFGGGYTVLFIANGITVTFGVGRSTIELPVGQQLNPFDGRDVALAWLVEPSTVSLFRGTDFFSDVSDKAVITAVAHLTVLGLTDDQIAGLAGEYNLPIDIPRIQLEIDERWMGEYADSAGKSQLLYEAMVRRTDWGSNGDADAPLAGNFQPTMGRVAGAVQRYRAKDAQVAVRRG